MAYYPEPPIDPPEERYDIAGCGHEIYDGESPWEWDGGTLCPECLGEKFDDLTLEEKAALLGAVPILLEQPTNTWGCAQ